MTEFLYYGSAVLVGGALPFAVFYGVNWIMNKAEGRK